MAKEFKRQFKVKPKSTEVKTEGKDRYGKLQKIKKTFLHDKESIEVQGSHEAKLIESPEYQKLIVRTYEYLKQGIPSNQILQTFMVEDDSMTEAKFTPLLKYAYQYGENELHKDREYIFQLHMKRYEELYRDSMVMEDSWHRPLDPKKDWFAIIRKYSSALKALRQKEELLGLHNKSMILEFNDNQATVVQQETLRGGANVVGGFDLEKLENSELAELVKLIEEIRVTPIDGIQRVVIKQTKIEIDINNGEREITEIVKEVDVTDKVTHFEDLPENVVEKFEDVTVVDDGIPTLNEPNTIDSVPTEYRKKPKTDEVDIKEKLREKALAQLKKKLKKG